MYICAKNMKDIYTHNTCIIYKFGWVELINHMLSIEHETAGLIGGKKK